MKNVLLLTASAAALTISAPAMAQNVSDLDQNGTGNDAVVAQVGSNSSDIDQDGADNRATLDQDGSNNASTIDQDSNS